MNGLKRKVHFVGVGGIGMSGLAEILLNLGYEVSGSDLRASAITRRLAGLGLRFSEGHAAENVGDARIVVVSAAVPEDNPEVEEARRQDVPVIHRSDLLADLIRLKPNAVVVGGTHGKTTTTSMISAFLDRANMGATSIIGGILHRSGTNARWGTGDCLVAEGDEHDGSFLRLHPTIAVVTNIDAEHLEYYGTVDRIQRAFTDFCKRRAVLRLLYRVPRRFERARHSRRPSRASASPTEPKRVRLSLLHLSSSVATIQAKPGPDRLTSVRTAFDVTSHDDRLGVTGRFGTHRDQRARHPTTCAMPLRPAPWGLCLGMRFPQITDGIRQFDGVQRRLQLCGSADGVTVVEDYAHHPTEIEATLEALRWMKPKRLICVFQPHLFSRTKFLCEEFARVLATADRTVVTDIYPAREEPMPGVDAGLIVDAAHEQGGGNVTLVKNMEDVPEAIAPGAEPGDIILVLGAGNINRIAEPILDALREH